MPSITIRADRASQDAWKQAADAQGMGLAQWMRSILDRAAKRITNQ